MEEIVLLKEDELLKKAEEYLKKFFGDNVTPENVPRRTCLVAYYDDKIKKDILESSGIKSIKFVSGGGSFSVFLLLDNDLKVQLVVNHPLNVASISSCLDVGQFIDLTLADKSGWFPAQIHGVKFAISKKPFSVRVELPLNAKIKIL